MSNLEFLKSIMSYNPEDGKFTSIVDRGPAKIGDERGWINFYGYRAIAVSGTTYLSHRLAFVFMGEEIPNFVDHINGDRADNRWKNLRPASKSQNNHNSSLRKDNTSGIKGVSWSKWANKYHVRLQVNGEQIHFGYWDDFEAAELVSILAREKYHGEFANHGRK